MKRHLDLSEEYLNDRRNGKRQARTLLKIHLEAENRGDIEGVMETFAPDVVMTYNHTEFPNPEAISAVHTYLGFSQMQGAFSPAQNVVDNVSFTETDVVVEGRMCGTHQGNFLGFEPTGNMVELPFVAMYRFEQDGKLSNEKFMMNLGPLNPDFFTAPEGLF